MYTSNNPPVLLQQLDRSNQKIKEHYDKRIDTTSKVVSSSIVSIDDAANVNAEDVKVAVEPVQDLHGYDKPWVGGAGKNKLPYPYGNTTKTENGVTFTDNGDGTITVVTASGGATADTEFVLANTSTGTSLNLPTGSYILNGCPSNGSTSSYWISVFKAGTNIGNDTGSGYSFSVTTGEFLGLGIRIKSGTIILSPLIFKPMIRLATETDSTFAPYTNICSISGRSEVAIDRVGKNYVYIENGTLENDATKSVQLRRCRTGNMCYIKANTDCVISASTLSGKIINISYQIWESNSFGSNTKLYDSGWQNVPTIINLSNNRWITFVVKYSDESNISFEDLNIQLELGSTATTYEPYAGKTYTIQLGQTVYGGTLDVTSGELVVDMAEVDLGNLNYTYNSEDSNFYSGNYFTDAKYDNVYGIGICENYFINNIPGSQMDNGGIKIQGNRLYIKDLRYSNATTFKIALNGVRFVYELATPFTIHLTPQQIKLLQGTNTVYSDSGQVYIEYQPDNVIGDTIKKIESNYDTQMNYIKDNLIPSRIRNDITSRLSLLSQAVAEQNLEKYGYKIGDYFTGASGYTYILADYNTFKGTSEPYCINRNHLGLVVDTHATSKWHTEDASSVGYNGSTLHTYLKGTVMDNIKSDFISLFGGETGLEHLFSHSKLLTTALANWAWQSNQYISALTCTQIDAGSQWTANGFQEGEASKSLELFRKYKWTEIFGGEYPWLRNISNYNAGACACGANYGGHLDGYNDVAFGHFVVGLILFY